MKWHPFIYNGLRTNIEFNELGQVKRHPTEWMKIKRKEKIVKLKTNNRGYQTLFFMTEDRKEQQMLLHQALAIVFFGHKPNFDNKVVDHIDGDKMNNKIENLQIISQRQNAVKYCIDKKELPTGVFYFKAKDKIRYRSYIYYNKKQRYLGYFDTIEDASEKYQDALNAIHNNLFLNPILQ
jgi:hypothetical protein